MGKGKVSTANRNFTETLTFVDVGNLEDLTKWDTTFNIEDVADLSSLRGFDMSTDGHHILIAARTDVALTGIDSGDSVFLNLYLDTAWDFSTSRINTDAGGFNDGTDAAAQAGYYVPFESTTRIGSCRYSHDGMYIWWCQEDATTFRAIRCKSPYVLPSTSGSTFIINTIADSNSTTGGGTKGLWFTRDGRHMYEVDDQEKYRIVEFDFPYGFDSVADVGTFTSHDIVREDSSVQTEMGDIAGSHFDNKNIWLVGRDSSVATGEITDPVSGATNTDDRIVEISLSTANDISTASAVAGSASGSNIMFRDTNFAGFARTLFVHEEAEHAGMIVAKNNGKQFKWHPFAGKFIGSATTGGDISTISFSSSAVSNVRAGDLMFVFVSNDVSNAATSAPSGWTELYEFSGFDGTSYASAYYKYATSSDTSFSKTYSQRYANTAILAVYRNIEIDPNASKGAGFGYHYRTNSTDLLPIPETRLSVSGGFVVCIHEQDNTVQAGTTSFTTPTLGNDGDNFTHRATSADTAGGDADGFNARSATFVFDSLNVIGGTANIDLGTFSANPAFFDPMLTTAIPIHIKTNGANKVEHIEFTGRKYTEAISSTAATTTHTPANFEDGDFFIRLYVQGGASTPALRTAELNEHAVGTVTGLLGTQNFRFTVGLANHELDTSTDTTAITTESAEIHMITDLYFKPYKKSRVTTTLTAGTLDNSSSMFVADNTDFPDTCRVLVTGPDENNVHVQTEIINIGSKFSNVILVAALSGREQDGTTGQFHATGATVTLLDDNDGYLSHGRQRSAAVCSNGGQGIFSLLSDGPTSSISSSNSEVSVDLNKCQAPFIVFFAGLQEDNTSTCTKADFSLDIDGTSVKETIAFEEAIDSSENSAASGTESFNLVVGAKYFNTNQTGTLTIKMLDRGDDRMIVAVPVEIK